MLIFEDDIDRQLFEMEVGDGGTNPLPDAQKQKVFFNRRKLIGSLWKNFRKSMDSRRQWTRHRFLMDRAVKKYQNSFQGKRHMRKLQHFNQTHTSFLNRPRTGLLDRETREALESLKDFLYFEIVDIKYKSVSEQLDNEDTLDFVKNLLKP